MYLSIYLCKKLNSKRSLQKQLLLGTICSQRTLANCIYPPFICTRTRVALFIHQRKFANAHTVFQQSPPSPSQSDRAHIHTCERPCVGAHWVSWASGRLDVLEGRTLFIPFFVPGKFCFRTVLSQSQSLLFSCWLQLRSGKHQHTCLKIWGWSWTERSWQFLFYYVCLYIWFMAGWLPGWLGSACCTWLTLNHFE